MAAIALQGIEKRYPNGFQALRQIDLQIADGEFLVLVGPSGCGKSTLLRVIAGLETASEGRVVLGDVDVTDVTPQRRDLAMVFQSYALYPHMSVRDNLAYGLRVRGTDRATVTRRVGEVAASLGLDAVLDRRPVQLSGGQRQRVALGRAMVRDPRAFLFDEPLSNLDPALRLQARAELVRLHRRLRATVVYVTHDQEEAMTLGTRVAVMREGRIEQIEEPAALYARPATTFVAGFIGTPPMNLLTGSLPSFDVAAGTTVGIRPHDVVIGAGALTAMVDVVEPRGPDAIVHLRVDGTTIVAVTTAAAPAVGSELRVDLPRDRLHLFDQTGRRR